MKRILNISLFVIAAAIIPVISCQMNAGANQELHEHTFSADWIGDKDSHWHPATCEHKYIKGNESRHVWSGYEVSVRHDCSTIITRKRICAVCLQEESEQISVEPSANHDWDTTPVETKSASYFSPGTKKYRCKGCGQEKVEIIEEKLVPVNLNSSGALKVLTDADLDVLGITATSVPAKIEGAQYIIFGVYPQTVKKADVQVSDGSPDVNDGNIVFNPDIPKAQYYLGSDGSWYAKVQEDAYGADFKYSDGTSVLTADSEKWNYFKVEPIVWRILKDENGKYLLFSEKILLGKISYYGEVMGEVSSRTVNGKTVYANNYKYSNIRAFLNSTKNQCTKDGGTRSVFDYDWTNKGFLHQAFTLDQRNRIVSTTVDNSASSTRDCDNIIEEAAAFADQNTSDRIFMLSLNEVTKSDYKFPDCQNNTAGNTRIKKPTDYALALNCSTRQFSNPNLGGEWMLRSPGRSSVAGEDYILFDCNRVRYVTEAGDANNITSVSFPGLGIVPAITINK